MYDLFWIKWENFLSGHDRTGRTASDGENFDVLCKMSSVFVDTTEIYEIRALNIQIKYRYN